MFLGACRRSRRRGDAGQDPHFPDRPMDATKTYRLMDAELHTGASIGWSCACACGCKGAATEHQLVERARWRDHRRGVPPPSSISSSEQEGGSTAKGNRLVGSSTLSDQGGGSGAGGHSSGAGARAREWRVGAVGQR